MQALNSQEISNVSGAGHVGFITLPIAFPQPHPLPGPIFPIPEPLPSPGPVLPLPY